jgi:maltose/moltooligosaccharide transporter
MVAARTSRKAAHMISLFCGGLGLASMSVISDPYLLLLSMVGVGIAWASILSMPYAILAGALPAEKMGVYMGIFNFFIVIPQIAAAGVLGLLMKHLLGNDAMNAILLGGTSMIIAAVVTIMVQDVDEQRSRETQAV